MEVHFERLALYEEVWSTPLTKLGEKYGMSDNGIRKVCKAMNIPLPKVGHWARVEAGQDVVKAELPADAEVTTFVSRPPPPPKLEFKREEDAIWLKDRLAFEEQTENQIVFQAHPARWHRSLISIRDAYKDAAKDYKKQLAARDADRIRRSKLAKPGVNLGAIYWRDLDAGILLHTHKANYLRVSSLTYERALAIVNALFFAAERRGCNVGIHDEHGRFCINLEKTSLYFAIRERQDTELITSREAYSYGSQTQKIPTDRLALVMGLFSFDGYELTDKDSARIETRLGEVFIRLYRSVVKEREAARENEVKRAREAVQRVAWEALIRQREEEAKVKAEEVKRREVLLAEADAWSEAEQIRAYVGGVVSQADSPPSPELKAWESWALQVAADKDPAPGRVAALRSSTANNGSGHGQEES
jgi:hypothetical protein